MKILTCILFLTLPCGFAAASEIGGAARPDTALAALADTVGAEARSSTLVLPALGYTPDTGAFLGAALLRFFYLEEDPDLRPSVASPVVIYTARSQILVFLNGDLNWGGNRWHARAGPSYMRFPDQFYGIGRDARLEDEEDYTPEQLAFEILVDRKWVRELRAGLSYRILGHRLKEVAPGGVLDAGAVVGTSSSLVSAPGVFLGVDTRDNTFSPGRGVQFSFRAEWARGWTGSDHDFSQYALDLRGYRALGDRTVVAGQLQATGQTGAPPFFLLPRLGGEGSLRGYRGSLYRDRVVALGRIELRRSNLWGRLGGVVFAGIGDPAPRLSDLTLSRRLWTAGFGLRFLMNRDEKVNLRVDMGFGHGDSGFFLSLGEAF